MTRPSNPADGTLYPSTNPSEISATVNGIKVWNRYVPGAVAAGTGPVSVNGGVVSVDALSTSVANAANSTNAQAAAAAASAAAGALTAAQAASTAAASKATPAYVDTKIADLIGSAPGALDTIQEIAAQLAADQTGVAALTTAVSGKIATTEKGAASGVATLGTDSKLPEAQLPRRIPKAWGTGGLGAPDGTAAIPDVWHINGAIYNAVTNSAGTGLDWVQ